jgi:diguanylate cyclase (GGDEF)-like protein
LLLPGAALSNARDVAERLRLAVRSTPITHFDGSALSSITVSIGAAQMPPDASLEGFIDKADRALYRAKNSGRDRVELSD